MIGYLIIMKCSFLSPVAKRKFSKRKKNYQNIFIKKKILLPLYNVVLVPAEQQSELVICMHVSSLILISFPFRSPQIIE